MRAFILAGGFATRLWPLTENRAKPLLPLAGKPILTHLIEKIPENIPVTVSTNEAFEGSFRQWQGTLPRSVDLTIERTTIDDHKLGALGAVALWVEQSSVDDDILLLTGDNYLGFPLSTFVDAYHDGTPLVAAYDIGDLSRASAFGTIVTEKDGKTISAFEEKPRHPKSTLVSTGCAILPRSALGILKPFAASHPDNVGGIFEELLRQKRTIECFRFSEDWFDIGSFESYLEATAALIGEAVHAEEGARLEECETSGSIALGKNSLATKSTLADTVLFENCVIEDCVLERCILDDDCVLKGVDLQGKMLRKGTRLIRE